ncbi:hypothetical protein [Neorhizobium sp. T7_12]|uniref:hypothetical protein n=1 Tax=Neorhizobium sp. T7_12 TaxID=2093832 RepID=UPI000CF9D4B3|nr:hypothetical protein [Neorhizobium sp. T7_12]
MKKEEIINRGNNAKLLLEAPFFIETMDALKRNACEQMWKTAQDDTHSRDILHAQMLNWNLCTSQLSKWVEQAEYYANDDVPEA